MKNISYLDMVHELLNDEDFLDFEKYYTQPITKSIKILNHCGTDKGNILEIVKTTLSQERDIADPDFSFNGKKYNDVLFATRKKGLKPNSLGNNFLHQAGLIYIQEMSAGLSAQILDVNKGDIVLDMCAAPGGKSIQIADKIGNGFLISNELDSGRLKALESNFHRCGIYNVGITHQDGRVFGDKLPEFFDKVLVDAPCSGEGMQYKSGKKIWQRDEKKCQNLSALQTQLLISGLKSLKVGGEIVYSTCTTNPLENEIVVSNILNQYGDSIGLLNVEITEKSDGISSWRGNNILSSEFCTKVARFWPHIQKTGGFFIAKFKKLKSLGNNKNLSLQGTENDFNNQIREKLAELGVSRNDNFGFVRGKYTINATVKSIVNYNFESYFPEIEIGLPIFKILKDSRNSQDKLVPLVGISKIFGSYAKNTIYINDDQLKLLMNKSDLHDDRLRNFEGKYVILKWNGIGVGLVSVQNRIGKNKCF